MPVNIPTGTRPGSLESPVPLEEERQQAAQLQPPEPVQEEIPQEQLAPPVEQPQPEPEVSQMNFSQLSAFRTGQKDEPSVGVGFRRTRTTPEVIPEVDRVGDADRKALRQRAWNDAAINIASSYPKAIRKLAAAEETDNLDEDEMEAFNMLTQEISPDVVDQPEDIFRKIQAMTGMTFKGFAKTTAAIANPAMIAVEIAQNPEKARDVLRRALGGIGRSPEEFVGMANLLGKDEFKVGKNGEVVVERGGRELPVDGPGFDSALELFGDLADMSGEFLTEAMATAGGTLGSGVGPGGTILGTAGGAALGVGAREGIVQAAEEFSGKKIRDDNVDLRNEMLVDVGLNSVMFVGDAFKGGKRIITHERLNVLDDVPVVGRLRRTLKQMSPESRKEAATQVIKDLDDVATEIGATGERGFNVAAKEAFDVLDRKGKELAEQIELVETKVLSLAGDEKVAAGTFLKEGKKQLDNMGVPFDGNTGLYSLPDVPSAIPAAGATAEEALEAAAKSAEIRSAIKSPEGRRALKALVSDYNSTLAAATREGGVSAKTMFDRVRDYRTLTQKHFNPSNPASGGGEFANMYKKMYNAAQSDRLLMVDAQLAKEPASTAAKIGESAFKNYATNIDKINDLKEIFGDENTVRKVVNIFNPDKAPLIRKVKEALGPGSKEWGSLRGAWVTRMVEESMDSVIPVLNADSFLKKLNSFRKDEAVLFELLDPIQYRKLQQIANNARDIAVSDLKPKERVGTAIQDTLNWILADSMMPSHRARLYWRLIGQYPNVDKWAAEDGLRRMLRNAATDKEREAIIETFEAAADIRKNARKISVRLPESVDAKKRVIELQVPGVKRFGLAAGASSALRDAINAPREPDGPLDIDPSGGLEPVNQLDIDPALLQ